MPKDLQELNMNMWNVGIQEMLTDMSAEGAGMINKVNASLAAAKNVGLDVSDEAKAILGDVEAVGLTLKKAGEGSEGAKALVKGGALGFGAMAADVEKLSKKDRAFVLGAGGDQLKFAYSARQRTARALNKAGSKRGKKDVALSKMFNTEAWAGMEEGQREKIMSIVGPDKIIGAGVEQEALKQFMSEKASSKTMAAAGIVQKNAAANPADIANSMSQFVGATSQLAAFVQTLATGEAAANNENGKKGGAKQ